METEWRSLLACPFCKGKLHIHQDEKNTEYWCLYDGVAFPTIGKTPIFINCKARTLSAEEKLSKKIYHKL